MCWAVDEPREAAEGGLQCGGNARTLHSMVQDPCQNVIPQRGLCCQDKAPYAVVAICAAQGGPTAALYVGGIVGKHYDAVSEASVELPAFELEGSGERKSIQQGRGGAAGAAEESSLGALAILRGERRSPWPLPCGPGLNAGRASPL
jgi:hypothetical protein